MRASLSLDPTAPDPTEIVVVRRRLPRPVVWLLWLVGALLGSVLLGFLAGLARPREPDPWAVGPTPDPPADQVRTTSSDSAPAAAEDD